MPKAFLNFEEGVLSGVTPANVLNAYLSSKFSSNLDSSQEATADSPRFVTTKGSTSK